MISSSSWKFDWKGRKNAVKLVLNCWTRSELQPTKGEGTSALVVLLLSLLYALFIQAANLQNKHEEKICIPFGEKQRKAVCDLCLWAWSSPWWLVKVWRYQKDGGYFLCLSKNNLELVCEPRIILQRLLKIMFRWQNQLHQGWLFLGDVRFPSAHSESQASGWVEKPDKKVSHPKGIRWGLGLWDSMSFKPLFNQEGT